MTIEERLEALEQELAASRQRIQLLWGSLGLILVVFIIAWNFLATKGSTQAQSAVKVIRANRFVVEDENRQPRAMLCVTENGPSLSLIDENGKPRAALAVSNDRPALVLFDEKGVIQAGLSIDKEGPRLLLSDDKGKPRAELKILKVGPERAAPELGLVEPTLALFGDSGEVRTMLSVDIGRGPMLTLYYENGEISTNIYSPDYDGPNMTLISRNGKIALSFIEGFLSLGNFDTGQVVLSADSAVKGLSLYDKNNKLRAEFGTGQTVTPDGRTIIHPESSLRLYKPDGKVIWSAP